MPLFKSPLFIQLPIELPIELIDLVFSDLVFSDLVLSDLLSRGVAADVTDSETQGRKHTRSGVYASGPIGIPYLGQQAIQ